MSNFYNIVLEVLKQDTRFFTTEGDILRNAVYEAAMQFDNSLIKVLFSNQATKERFFTDVDGIAVFDKIGFGWVVNNRQFLPDSYTRFKNKIGLINKKGEYISESNDVELVFPYKDCVLEGGQTKEDQKREEIFYNETLAPDERDRLLYPKVFTNATRYTKDGAHNTEELQNTDNLIIKGNNLLSVHSLLKKYKGKIKCIYIDPPYNPLSQSNTFCYNNRFNRSTWLTFMKNRLECAKELLSKDGVLIVAIDKNEQPYLQILINEIFDEYDTDCITVVHNPRGVQGTNFSYTHEFAIFVTPKGKKTICNRSLDVNEIDFSNFRNWGGESLRTDAKNCFYPVIVKDDIIVGFGDVMVDTKCHPDNQTVKVGDCYYVYPIDVKGIERKWRYARQSVEEIKSFLRPKKSKGKYEIEIGKNFGLFKTVWTNSKYDANEYGTKLLNSLVEDNPFKFPKSLYNVMDCINAVVKNDKDAIVLDFFAGSGTTAHAVFEINRADEGNRKFILCEQMEYVQTVTVKRIYEVIKKTNSPISFVYCELKELNQKYIEMIQLAKTEEELWNVRGEICSTGFISSFVSIKEVDENTEDYKALSFENKKKLFMAIIDKNMLYVNLCDIDDEEFAISEKDKAFTKSFYGRG